MQDPISHGRLVDAVFAFFVRAGPDWVMMLLLALGILALAVCAERYWRIRGAKGKVAALASLLEQTMLQGRWEQAHKELAPLSSTIACVARSGLSRVNAGSPSVQWAMQAAFAHERKRLEARLGILSTLGTNAPFVGLLGTVIGIVLAFEQLGQGNSSGTSPAVMGAIAEALVATAVGIGVALPCVAAYNYFQRAITEISDDVEVISSFILSHLEPNKPNAPKPASEHSP